MLFPILSLASRPVVSGPPHGAMISLGRRVFVAVVAGYSLASPFPRPPLSLSLVRARVCVCVCARMCAYVDVLNDILRRDVVTRP